MRHYLAAIGGIVLATILLAPFHALLSLATVALALLLVVLFVAAAFGSRPAFLASILGVLSFNFFFIPPLYTLTIADPQNWIALSAFLITAITAGQLSSYARRRAEESEKLYQELQAAFAKASQAEALRQSERLKSALLDAVTHDLRTPLTSIKAAVTTLIDDERESEFKLGAEGKQEFLEIINEETDRLNKFIEGMVELARAEAGAMQLRQTWSGIDEIIAAALTRAENLLKNYRVRLEIEKELPSVRVDAKALAEVIYTVLDNAAKYSPANSQIVISAEGAEGEMVKITVADEGRGVSAEMRERVFEKFFRVGLADENKAAVGGLGLGLAIARGIIESHGGKIWIDDNDNKHGTKVIFTVPIGDE